MDLHDFTIFFFFFFLAAEKGEQGSSESNTVATGKINSNYLRDVYT